MSKQLKVGLLWHSFRSENLGVGALSVCNIQIIEDELRKLGMRESCAVIGNDGQNAYAPGCISDELEFVHFSAAEFVRHPLSIRRPIQQCDVVFDIGEGDSFSDIYGLGRLLKLSVSKWFAISGGRPLVLSPQVIGPFKSVVGRLISTYLMRRAAAVVSRDHMSMDLLREMRLDNAHEAVDVAFLLPFVQENLPDCDGKLRFGLNVSGLLFYDAENGGSRFGIQSDYKAFTLDLIKDLLDSTRFEIHLIGHVNTQSLEYEDDCRVCQRIKSLFPQCVLAPRFTTPESAKGYIAAMDLFAGARMHSTIGAFSAGVPVIPLAYSRKFSGLFESIGYSRVLDLRSLESAELIASIVQYSGAVEQLKQEVQQSATKIDQRLGVYRESVHHVLRELRDRSLI